MTEERPSRIEVFVGWHREPSLWREIYARSLSALIAGLVIYLIGALSGVFSRDPLRVLAPILCVLAWGGSVLLLTYHPVYEGVPHRVKPWFVLTCWFLTLSLTTLTVWYFVTA